MTRYKVVSNNLVFYANLKGWRDDGPDHLTIWMKLSAKPAMSDKSDAR
jgi:hypothetical protein